MIAHPIGPEGWHHPTVHVVLGDGVEKQSIDIRLRTG